MESGGPQGRRHRAHRSPAAMLGGERRHSSTQDKWNVMPQEVQNVRSVWAGPGVCGGSSLGKQLWHFISVHPQSLRWKGWGDTFSRSWDSKRHCTLLSSSTSPLWRCKMELEKTGGRLSGHRMSSWQIRQIPFRRLFLWKYSQR